MLQGLRRRVLAALVVLTGVAVFASTASATITPTVTPSATSALPAGQTGNLGLDLKFAPSSGDTPDALTLELPPGLLSNVSIDNGGCLQQTDINDATCEIGTGTVSSSIAGVPAPLTVGFYLTPPPAAGDLAGLTVAAAGGQQIGATAPITIRPSGDPAGVGATISLVLPNNISGVPLSISEINATFDGLRFPTTCPATPAQILVSATSYDDPTVKTASTPVPVTGCSTLPYAPKYAIAVAKDSGSKSVKVTTTITQAADESPNSSVQLSFGLNNFQPALGGLQGLCSAGIASGTCKPVGSVTAQSPLYPTALTGQAYLTGTLQGLTITLVFPAPFPLTLVGSVNLNTNVTTFTGLPDIPLTDLAVTLNSGSTALFSTNCAQASGTSTATLTDQNGDETAKPTSSYTIANCGAPPTSPTGTSKSGSGSSSSAKAGTPKVSSTRLAGLKTGKPSLRFTATAGKHAPKLKTVTVSIPKGLTLVPKKGKVKGVSVKGAKLSSATAKGGKLVVTFKAATKKATIIVGSKALKESAGLKKKAAGKKKLKTLKLTVVARNASGKRTTIHVTATKLGL
jgi:hypothetical protein